MSRNTLPEGRPYEVHQEGSYIYIEMPGEGLGDANPIARVRRNEKGVDAIVAGICALPDLIAALREARANLKVAIQAATRDLEGADYTQHLTIKMIDAALEKATVK